MTPEEANRIGYELGMSWTKGKHAYIVTTHIDKAHVHNHIYYNSTSLDCTRKFRNFWNSSFAIRRVSDRICLEHGLSIVKNPKPRSKGKFKNYGEWLGDNKPPTFQERLSFVSLFWTGTVYPLPSLHTRGRLWPGGYTDRYRRPRPLALQPDGGTRETGPQAQPDYRYSEPASRNRSDSE